VEQDVVYSKRDASQRDNCNRSTNVLSVWSPGDVIRSAYLESRAGGVPKCIEDVVDETTSVIKFS